MSLPPPQAASTRIEMHASTSPSFEKEYWSNFRVPVAVDSGPGHALGAAQPLGAPSRPRREFWSASEAERSPERVCEGPPPQVGRLKPNVPVTPLASWTERVS